MVDIALWCVEVKPTVMSTDYNLLNYRIPEILHMLGKSKSIY